MNFNHKIITSVQNHTDLFVIYENSDHYLAIDLTYEGRPCNIKIKKDGELYKTQIRYNLETFDDIFDIPSYTPDQAIWEAMDQILTCWNEETEHVNPNHSLYQDYYRRQYLTKPSA